MMNTHKSLQGFFELSHLQKIQDEFSDATGVSSIIVLPDGKHLIQPSNFTKLCTEILGSEIDGSRKCAVSNALLGKQNFSGPVTNCDAVSGLLEGGAKILAGDRHLGNWLIGQVRDEARSEQSMREYARSLCIDEDTFMEAYLAVPVMSLDKFTKIAQFLFTIVNQLSSSAYVNLHQAKVIDELTEADRLNILSLAIEQSPVTTMITDSEGLIEYVNPKFTALTGYSPEEAIGQNPRILKDPDKPKAEYVAMWNTLLEGKNWQGVFHNKKKNGEWYWESAVISPVKNEDGCITHFLAIKEDITERKLSEEKIQGLLAEKELILKEVHHRIKNNMNTIYGVLQLQSQTLTDSSAIAALQDASNRVRSMMVLYTNLYQAANFNEMSIAEYLPPLLDEIMANFPNSKSVTIEKEIDDFILHVSKLQPLGIIINELLTNIMKYAFPGKTDGVVYVSALLENEDVTIVIEDNGNGMPESVDFKNSTGFGLVLVAGLTKQISGTIRIERKKGTRIILEFKR